MESLLTAPDKPVLNKADSSLNLELFWYNISGDHMFYHIISHCAYAIVVCAVFEIMLRVLAIYQKQNVEYLILF